MVRVFDFCWPSTTVVKIAKLGYRQVCFNIATSVNATTYQGFRNAIRATLAPWSQNRVSTQHLALNETGVHIVATVCRVCPALEDVVLHFPSFCLAIVRRRETERESVTGR